DQNFKELHERLEKLEETVLPLSQGGVTRITQEGAELLFESASEEVLGRVTLPSLRFRPRGLWVAQRDYLFYDLCLFGGKTYCCKTAHKSGDALGDDLSKWDLIFAAE
ncbi:MAG TPA: hypothetical protein DD412_06610, partial [Holosporales bacterium]|nr:hypothetical protein [Holosporales bacterium]